MNCDQVFQQLSSVHPAPQNGAMSEHLSVCPACRQMADLFGPAVRLLGQEPNEIPETPNQSSDRWAQVWLSASVAERAAAQIEQCSDPNHRRKSNSAVGLRFAAVLLVGILVGSAGTAAISRFSSPEPASTAGVGSNVHHERQHECRFEGLIEMLMQSDSTQFCVNCRLKVAAELASTVTVCMVCHIKPATGGDDLKPSADARSNDWKDLAVLLSRS